MKYNQIQYKKFLFNNKLRINYYNILIMVLINNDFKDALVNKINGILDLDDEHWNNLDKKMKLKYIHRLCNYLEDNKIEKLETLTIPLKSIKPKKLIQYCGISNQYNKNLYLQFNKSILDYTYNFRNKYVKIPRRQYYTYNSLPTKEYNQILNDYNEIIYIFMNKNKIDINNLLKSVVNTNFDKLITNINQDYEYKFNYLDNEINIIMKDFIINFTLGYSSNSITNNIPVKYCVKLINNI